MLGLSKLWHAVSVLTGSLLNVAATVDEINVRIRQQARLDTPAEEVPALPEGVPHEEEEEVPASSSNGRRQKTRAK